MRKSARIFPFCLALASLLGQGCSRPAADAEPDVSAEHDFTAPRVAWHRLDAGTRAAILKGLDARPLPELVILHSSGSPSASATAMDDNHRRVRGLPDGLAYHFLIGNGSGLGDGAIHVGRRWLEGQAAAALEDPGLAPGAVAICLIGDFSRDAPTPAQLAALDELLDFLETRIGRKPVRLHREVEANRRGCPGAGFPVKSLRAAYPD